MQNGGNYKFTQTGGVPQNFNQDPNLLQWRADNAQRRQEQMVQAMTTQQDPQQQAFTQVDPQQQAYAYQLVTSEQAARNRAIVGALVTGAAVRIWQHLRRH